MQILYFPVCKSTIWVLRITDHAYFVHPSTDISVDISMTYRSSVGRHIDRCSTDMSVDMSTDTRPIYRSRCVGRHINRHINKVSADISTDTRPICRSICRPRVVVRQSADMSTDRLPTFRRYLTNRIE